MSLRETFCSWIVDLVAKLTPNFFTSRVIEPNYSPLPIQYLFDWLFWVQKLDSVLVSLITTCSFCRLLDSLAILWFPWGQILCLNSASSGCPSQCMAFHKCLINACGVKQWTYWKSLNLSFLFIIFTILFVSCKYVTCKYTKLFYVFIPSQ